MKFSVLMSLYAKEKLDYFILSMNSIWSQTLLPNEVVLMVDGPIDLEMDKVVNQFRNIHKELEVYYIPQNKGLSNALNEGLKRCKYDYVLRMDTDDICYNDRFEKQIAYLSTHQNVDVLGSYATCIDEKGGIINELTVPINNNDIYKLIWTCPFIHPTVAIKRTSIINIGGYNSNSGPRQDDYELWFRCAYNKLNFANLDTPLLHYRYFSDNLKKNTIKVGWWRLKVGLYWSIKLKCSFVAFFGVMYPLFRALLPYKLRFLIHNKINKFNPRNSICCNKK